MLMVLIVGAVVLVFCLSLLLVTYSLFAQTSRQITRLQCKLLAQSFSESLGEELKDPASGLSVYLKEQIQNGYWISGEASQSMDESSSESAAVSELLMNMDDEAALGDYHVTVALTYSVNVADDEGGDEGEEGDDQDPNLGGEAGSGEGPGPTAGEDPGASGTTYSIQATVKCVRGDGSDRDAQYYVIETVYPAVSF